MNPSIENFNSGRYSEKSLVCDLFFRSCRIRFKNGSPMQFFFVSRKPTGQTMKGDGFVIAPAQGVGVCDIRLMGEMFNGIF
jgi:hypothetical protein